MEYWRNGIKYTVPDPTKSEIAAMQEAAAQAEAEEKRRPLSLGEVQEMLIRQQINALTVDDQMAYRMREFYPEWEASQGYTVGYKITYNGELYKVLQAHTSQEAWKPGTGTESLYARIDEQHDGSKYDPIPYNGNMALESGKYYSQDGVTYHCTRDTGNPVYHALSALVGLYVEVVSTGAEAR